MIEIVIAALLQLATISSDASVTTTGDQAATQTQTEATDGGTGTWDDNGVYAN